MFDDLLEIMSKPSLVFQQYNEAKAKNEPIGRVSLTDKEVSLFKKKLDISNYLIAATEKTEQIAKVLKTNKQYKILFAHAREAVLRVTKCINYLEKTVDIKANEYLILLSQVLSQLVGLIDEDDEVSSYVKILKGESDDSFILDLPKVEDGEVVLDDWD